MPNPAYDYVEIILAGITSDYQIRVIDKMGRIVYIKDVSKHTLSTQLNTSLFASGVYTILATSKDLNLIKRLVVQD